MVPYSNFMTMERVYGPSQITRYNLVYLGHDYRRGRPGCQLG